MVDLRDDGGVVFMNSLHKLCKARNIGVARNGELALVRLALGADVSVFGDDESDAAALGARVVVCEQVSCTVPSGVLPVAIGGMTRRFASSTLWTVSGVCSSLFMVKIPFRLVFKAMLFYLI